MDEIDAQKKRLRTEFRARRAALSDADYAARSARLVQRLLALPEIAAARTVHLFWPMTDRREPDLRPFAAALRSRGTAVVLPAVASLDPPRMAHRVLLGGDVQSGALRPDAAGIPTATGPEADRKTFDAVVVPALAVDRRGLRLGYGKGFYDRFLSGYPGFTLCPVFSEFFVEALPAGPYDVPVRAVVTDTALWRVPASKTA